MHLTRMKIEENKTLLLGNSHLAAFRKLKEVPNISMVGFSEYHGGILNLESDYKKQILYLSKIASEQTKNIYELSYGSLAPVVMSEFDFVFVIGIIPPPNVWEIVNTCVWNQEEKRFLGVGEIPITEDIFGENFQKKNDLNFFFHAMEILKNYQNTKKIYFIPHPYRVNLGPMEDSLSPPDCWNILSSSLRIEAISYAEYLWEMFFSQKGAKVIPIPPKLRDEGNLCSLKYSKNGLGSKNFDFNRPPQWGNLERREKPDLSHKNDLYGEEYWKFICNMFTII